MYAIQQKHGNPQIYAVLCGRMTLKQKEIFRQRAEIDTKVLTALLTWFIKHSGHPAYKDLTVPAECPKPKIVQGPDTANKTNVDRDVAKEPTFTGSTFNFSPGTHPTSENSVYETNEKLVMAMMNCTMPMVHFMSMAESMQI